MNSFSDPFSPTLPPESAQQAAALLLAELRGGLLAAELRQQPGGKMFGVLVCASPHGLVTLRGFSGMLGGTWHQPGFVPPLFDEAARLAIEPAGAAEIHALTAEVQRLQSAPQLQRANDALRDFESRAARAREEMRGLHQEQKASRAKLRQQGVHDVHELDQQSRYDKAQRRRLDEALNAEHALLAAAVATAKQPLEALITHRKKRSLELMNELYDTYVLRNARGETRRLRELFTGEPPAGAGECAAPKLLAHAFREGLQPLALAEFYFSAAPDEQTQRRSGAFSPPCTLRCKPLLGFMMQGLTLAPNQLQGSQQSFRVIYEDSDLLVVCKPHGSLSTPGKQTDNSLQTALRHTHGLGVRLAHRLDRDTSGLLIAAKNHNTYTALQRQFAERTVTKVYTALVEGDVAGNSGRIDLALRVDVDDRPRQIHDAVHGKPAITEWRVIDRRNGRTLLELRPLTGRTHQLRVHCAHPLGLHAPIVGDPLYGKPDVRLFLHAESLQFTHPATGATTLYTWPNEWPALKVTPNT